MPSSSTCGVDLVCFPNKSRRYNDEFTSARDAGLEEERIFVHCCGPGKVERVQLTRMNILSSVSIALVYIMARAKLLKTVNPTTVQPV